MTRFYDPRDTGDLARVETLLRHGGIGYTVRPAGDGGAFREILVAEEDLPRAERLLAG